MIFDLVTLTFQVVLLKKKLSWTMTFESEGLLIVAIYIWLPPASYVVFSDNSGLLCCRRGHHCFTNTCLVILEMFVLHDKTFTMVPKKFDH